LRNWHNAILQPHPQLVTYWPTTVRLAALDLALSRLRPEGSVSVEQGKTNITELIKALIRLHDTGADSGEFVTDAWIAAEAAIDEEVDALITAVRAESAERIAALTQDRDSWRRVCERLETEKQKAIERILEIYTLAGPVAAELSRLRQDAAGGDDRT